MDGRVYTGEWKDDMKHGKGKMEFAVEQYTSEGGWENDGMEGAHTVTHRDGKVRRQRWVGNALIAEDE
jgi:hypothetical protein